MNYSGGIKTGYENKTGKLISGRMSIEKNKDRGMGSLKKGQHITGIVTAVNEHITFDFDGQEVKTLKSVLKNAKVGDIKTFEVIRATDNEIELRVLDSLPQAHNKTIKAVMTNKLDWDTVLSYKEQAAKRVEKEEKNKETKSKLEEISAKITEKDCQLLEKEGFSIESFTVEGLSKALDRIKDEISGSHKYRTNEKGSYDKAGLEKRLREVNLPVTPENLTKLSGVMEFFDSIMTMDDKTMENLISTSAEPTPWNIYKACYSGNYINQSKNLVLSDQAWKELEGQIKEVITSAGYRVNEESLSDARWLLEKQLPLTVETLTYKKGLDSLRATSDKDILLDKILIGMRDGTNPMDVPLLSKDNLPPEQILKDIASISEESISHAVKEGEVLTINNLLTIGKSRALEGEAKVVDGEAEGDIDYIEEEASAKEVKLDHDRRYEELKARRQLEEIRLKMTLEAAGQLQNKGFSIETEELSRVVDELRELEDIYYRNLLKEGDLEASEASLQILKETTQSVERLKYIPSSVLGSTLAFRQSQTMETLLTEGSKLQGEYAKAGAAYETLATIPNREYGDSLKKAFANSDYLLKQMNLEDTLENKRALRILGYNQMEITNEAINQVKVYDEQVTSLLQNLHPAVTVRMIKEGINPLNMPINELNQTIDRILEEQGITSEEKFSTYLRNLEKEKGISPEERKSYIGIYRLLHNIEKSDGAALGAVIKTNREVTLANLLSAVQTNRKGRIDAAVNDEFGALESITHNKETIADQLSGLSEANTNSSRQEQDQLKEQTEYLNRILKHIKEEITPAKLKETGSSLLEMAATESQVMPLTLTEEGIWDRIKELPLEKLLNQLRSVDNPEGDQEIYTNKIQELRELCKNAEQSIRFLNDYRMPSSPVNMMLANHILSNGESPIKKLLKIKDDLYDENSENSLKESEDLSDTLIDKQSMQEAYEQLETDAKEVLNQACSQEVIDSRRLAELKSLGQQITFVRQLAEKEFYQIPIETQEGITNINLTILRGRESLGKVMVNAWSDQLGNIKAEFILKDQSLKGFISCDHSQGLKQMQELTPEIEKVALANNLVVKQIDFGLHSKDKESYSYQYPISDDNTSSSTSKDTERTLYQVAKAVIQMLRSAENSIRD